MDQTVKENVKRGTEIVDGDIETANNIRACSHAKILLKSTSEVMSGCFSGAKDWRPRTAIPYEIRV